jgi:cytochrome P450
VTTTVTSAVEWPRWEDPAFYLQDAEVIQASMAAQRQAAPVSWYEAPGLTSGFWVLSKWEDVRFVGSHPELFCNRYGFLVGDTCDPATVWEQLPAWAQEELSKPGLTAAQKRGLIARGKGLSDPGIENMIFLDPPRHGQVRSIFMQALKPSLVRSLKPRMAEIADEFLDEIEPGTVVDFTKTVGRIPATLMTELIGVPRELREQFIEMASANLEAMAITPDKDPAEVERIQGLTRKLHVYCDQLLQERRESGGAGEDLVSVVAGSELDGVPVTRDLAFRFVVHFIVAGETTRDLLSHLALALAQRPEQRRLLLERPELLPNAIEETLRYYPANWTGCRTATQRVEISGRTMEQDDFVVLAYASANRDEDVWERPDEYDIMRSFERDHLGFGHGEHSCPGALLARVDSAVIWERVLARFGDWELAGEPVTWSNPFLRGVASLPVRFERKETA